MKQSFLKVGIYFSILFSLEVCWAWGTVGHYTSAQIALTILNSQKSRALVHIAQILESEDFVKSSTWADEIRGSKTENWSQTLWYHFEKIEDDVRYLDHLKTLDSGTQKNGGVVTAILYAEEVLKTASSTPKLKAEALKFLIHFIGDAHQPLHTGRVNDNGGNKISVKWLAFNLTLHQVWDSQIIALGHKALFARGSTQEQINAYASYLLAHFKSLDLSRDYQLTQEDWIAESMAPRAEAYFYKNEPAEQYTRRFLEVADRRVYLAGVRIASTLHRLFGESDTGAAAGGGDGAKGSPAFVAETQTLVNHLRDQIELIVGNLKQLVLLSPSNDPKSKGAYGSQSKNH